MRFLPFLVLLAAATASADEEYRELVVDGNEVSQRQRYRFWVQSTGQVFCGASLGTCACVNRCRRCSCHRLEPCTHELV